MKREVIILMTCLTAGLARAATSPTQPSNDDRSIALKLLVVAKADVLQIDELSFRGDFLLDIARCQISAGEHDAAVATLKEAEAAMHESKDELSEREFLFDAAAVHVLLHDLAGADTIIARMEAPTDQEQALVAVARAQLKTGDSDGARISLGRAYAAAGRVQDPDSRMIDYLDVAEEQKAAGDANGESVSLKEARTLRAHCLNVYWQQRADEILDKVEKSEAKQSPPPVHPGNLLTRMITSFPVSAASTQPERIVDIQFAKGVADGQTDPWTKARMLYLIACQQAGDRDIAGAKTTAATIVEPPDWNKSLAAPAFKFYSFATIAFCQAKFGDLTGTIETVKGECAEPGQRAGLLIAISGALLNTQGLRRDPSFLQPQ